MKSLIEPSWAEVLASEFEQPYWQSLVEFVERERSEHPGEIYPPEGDVFQAFAKAPFNEVKMVVLGQDPYHGPGQAHGLSFSVPTGMKLPPSLRNIFRELSDDLGGELRQDGCLAHWADQGVLLLNTVLTVRRGEANSHRKQGWETFTDAAISRLNERTEPIVFVLWGGPAQKKASKIDETRHVVFRSAHPSPLSAHRGFFSSKPFSKSNESLESLGYEPIRW